MKRTVTALLMDWHLSINKRKMPWKGVKDPYKIWLSEVILQQTRVEQGVAYYEKFILKYPAIQDLAAAKDEEVFKLWEGLGYYNRCKNLLHTARYIVANYDGQFPANYEDIRSLKGVGPYTAAAITSFAFNMPFAVLDGNVFRVLSRLYAIFTPIDILVGKKQYMTLAQELLDKDFPGLYNQAIMDFGATVCLPVNPLCNSCNLQFLCEGYKKAVVNKLPIKEKGLLKKKRWFYYFIFQQDDKILVLKRTLKDIWENLHEFYLMETSEQINWDEEKVKDWLFQQFGMEEAKISYIFISSLQKQLLTHQQIKGQFIVVKLVSIPDNLKQHQWLDIKDLRELAFPKFINQFLDTRTTQE